MKTSMNRYFATWKSLINKSTINKNINKQITLFTYQRQPAQSAIFGTLQMELEFGKFDLITAGFKYLQCCFTPQMLVDKINSFH